MSPDSCLSERGAEDKKGAGTNCGKSGRLQGLRRLTVSQAERRAREGV